MQIKVGFISLGCPKNLIDSEIMLGMIKKENYNITNNIEEADVLIVNTCGFIESAKQESIDTILELAEYKKGICKKLIVTGCLAEKYSQEIIKDIPEVDAVLGIGNIDEIVKLIQSDEQMVLCGNKNKIYPEKANRLIDISKTYAYLKIAEGCNNCCSYCSIPSIRGSFRSRKVENILNEAREIVEKGINEIILVAQDTTKYGIDIYKKNMIIELIRELSKIKNLKWIRLLYCYPEEINDNLVEEFRNNQKLVNYIDMPIQHINDNILKRMKRKGDRDLINNVIVNLRNKIDDITIRTSIITGFPGETVEEHRELCNYIREIKFDRLGVFKYSEEEDTEAYNFENKISEVVKQERYNELMLIQKDISNKNSKRKLGKIYKCVVEGVADDGIFYYGRSFAEAPDIDGLVYFTSINELKFNDYVSVKILNSDDYDLIGEVKN